MTDANEFTVTLAIDGMYYHEAMRMRELAAARDKEFIEAQSRVSTTEQDLLNVMNDPARGIDSLSDEDVDDYSLELHNHWQPVQIAGTQLIRAVATTHILCATALEAHI